MCDKVYFGLQKTWNKDQNDSNDNSRDRKHLSCLFIQSEDDQGCKNTGDRPGCTSTYGSCAAVHFQEQGKKIAAYSGYEINDGIFYFAEIILGVLADGNKCDHISHKMFESEMDEHGSEQSVPLAALKDAVRGLCTEFKSNLSAFGTAVCRFDKEYKYIYSHKDKCDDRFFVFHNEVILTDRYFFSCEQERILTYDTYVILIQIII